MKYFYISNETLSDHMPDNNVINCLTFDRNIVWTTHISSVEQHIINTYNFDRFIFVINWDYIDLLNRWDLHKKAYIIVFNHTDKRDCLHQLLADVDLDRKIVFADNKKSAEFKALRIIYDY